MSNLRSCTNILCPQISILRIAKAVKSQDWVIKNTPREQSWFSRNQDNEIRKKREREKEKAVSGYEFQHSTEMLLVTGGTRECRLSFCKYQYCNCVSSSAVKMMRLEPADEHDPRWCSLTRCMATKGKGILFVSLYVIHIHRHLR